jgi:hypothetical protein
MCLVRAALLAYHTGKVPAAGRVLWAAIVGAAVEEIRRRSAGLAEHRTRPLPACRCGAAP